MRLEHLQYFITLANSPSINKAAEKLFISQQQLNRIITTLENDVNAELFHRTTNGISLTENGRIYLQYAQKIINEYTALKNHFYLQQQQSILNIPKEPSVCKLILAPCLFLYSNDIASSLKTIAPNIKLIIYDKTTQLAENQFDHDAIYFWASDILSERFSETFQASLQMISLGTSSSYFIYNKLLHPDEKLPKPYRISTYFSHVPSAKYYNEIVSDTYIEPHVLVSSNVYQLLDSVVQNDTTCTLPDFALPKIFSQYPELAFIPLLEHLSPIHVLYSSDKMLSQSDNFVIQFIDSYIQNLQTLAKLLTQTGQS